MLENIFRISKEQLLSVHKIDDYLESDKYIRSLGPIDIPIIAFNPSINDVDQDLIYWLDDLRIEDKCLVLNYNDICISKIFPPYWVPHLDSYQHIDIKKPKYIWNKNPDLDKLMKFKNDPIDCNNLSPWDKDYELVWYLDPKVNPTKDKIWVYHIKPLGRKIKGIKDMGFLMPDINIEFNSELPKFNFDVESNYPPYWELQFDNVLMLNSIHQNQENLWAIKFSPNYRKSQGWREIGEISPVMRVVYNPVLGDLNYDLDHQFLWSDFKYEHVWLLNRSYLNEDEEDIWAFKIKLSENILGTKIVGYISPTYIIERNSALQNLNYDIDYNFKWHDLQYRHVWYLDKNYSDTDEKIWNVKISATNNVKGEKEVGNIIPIISSQLDVIFISYNEPNAEENWKRVLEKAPWAKRVSGVSGIFNAHKSAAKLSSTDMFYVVDGDAYLVDDWDFNFQPGIFDRDCAYVWLSQNPINDLIYEYGGVKLFSKSVLMKQKKWITLDMFTGIMKKIKVEEKISCITRFNLNEFSTWRSAFRECVKLYVNNNTSVLNTWLTKGKNRKFGKYAIHGARDAVEFVKENSSNLDILLNINDYAWLENKFKNKYKLKNEK